MKVVIVRAAPENIRRLIAGQFPAGWQIVTASPQSLIDAITDADALIPEGTRVDTGLLAHAENLKFIQTGAGYDNIDIKACSRRGIQVANAAGINARAVAEHVLAFIFCWYKNIGKLSAAMKNGNFAVDYTGSELSGKVIGVVGLGRTGREVVRMAQALDLKVIGCHYRQAAEVTHIDLVGLDRLLKQADIVTIHVALNEQTRHMISTAQFALMKKDSFFINTSRGAVVDEQSLIEALRLGRIGGAALDVYPAEPLPPASPLRQFENVILTPHTAGEPDALYFHAKRFKFFAENIARFDAGHPILNELQPVGQRC